MTIEKKKEQTHVHVIHECGLNSQNTCAYEPNFMPSLILYYHRIAIRIGNRIRICNIAVNVISLDIIINKNGPDVHHPPAVDLI